MLKKKSVRLLCFIFILLGSSHFSEAKKYIDARELLTDSFRLAAQVFESGFRPTFLIALWRGGAPIGIAITEYFTYQECPIRNHGAVRVSSYDHDKQRARVEIFRPECIAEQIEKHDKILIVDDVGDSGHTLQAYVQKLKDDVLVDIPDEDIKVATIYYKPKTSIFKPNYYLHETDEWLVFPHELEGMSIEEIASNKGAEIAQTIQT